MLYMYTCNMYMYIDTVSFGRYNLSIPMGYVNGIYIYIYIYMYRYTYRCYMRVHGI